MLFSEPSEFFFTAGYQSPLGPLDLIMSERGLAALSFQGHWVAPYGAKDARWIEEPSRFRVVMAQLDEYFAGERRTFDLKLDLRGTDFQRRVWQALGQIPYGQTLSYAELATHLGSPGASRAVGQANHRNPIAIIVPCHRVIAADRTLGGYAGGAAAKQYLLNLEGAHYRPAAPEQGCLFDSLAG